MKRLFFGVVWFVVIGFLGLAVGGSIAGAIAGANSGGKNFADGYNRGYQAGHAAGEEFGRRYGRWVILGALMVAAAGTAFRVLPGTKAKQP